MSAVDDNGPERGGDDIVAAEYVLGVLPADERQAVARRIESEPAFARLVDRWEAEFLADGRGLRRRSSRRHRSRPPLDRRLFSAAPAPTRAAAPGLWSSLAFWRGLAVAALAALALFVALPYDQPAGRRAADALVASLAPRATATCTISSLYDAAHGAMSALRTSSGERGDGRDFELWMIEGEQAPVSMGVIPVGAIGASRRSAKRSRQNSRPAPCSPSASSRRAVRRPASRPALSSRPATSSRSDAAADVVASLLRHARQPSAALVPTSVERELQKIHRRNSFRSPAETC